jgi:hypothetical protein
MKAVAMNITCSTRAIRHHWQRFQATGRTRSGRPTVTTPTQDLYIRNSQLRNRFQTATATAANTPGAHNNIYPNCAIACTRVGYIEVDRMLVVI